MDGRALGQAGFEITVVYVEAPRFATLPLCMICGTSEREQSAGDYSQRTTETATVGEQPLFADGSNPASNLRYIAPSHWLYHPFTIPQPLAGHARSYVAKFCLRCGPDEKPIGII